MPVSYPATRQCCCPDGRCVSGESVDQGPWTTGEDDASRGPGAATGRRWWFLRILLICSWACGSHRRGGSRRNGGTAVPAAGAAWAAGRSARWGGTVGRRCGRSCACPWSAPWPRSRRPIARWGAARSLGGGERRLLHLRGLTTPTERPRDASALPRPASPCLTL
jgi:hypothetical protein